MENKELLTPNQIIKTRRKSVSLIIKSNGDFIVRAPTNAKETDILKFINQKADWIIKKRTEQISCAIKPLTFSGNEKIMFLGKYFNLTYNDTSKIIVDEDDFILPIDNSKEKLTLFLKKYAKQYISERVNVIAELFNFSYKSISITSARTCWGSCSHDNKLHFTYKLIMCPTEVIDYIILHELCHTRVKNHSSKFWSLVEGCNPYYKIHEKWLKKNRAIIDII